MNKEVNPSSNHFTRDPSLVYQLTCAVTNCLLCTRVFHLPSSPAPSRQGSFSRSRTESEGSGGGGGAMRARVAHQPGGSNQTLLPFSRGEMITVLVQQPKNGWLYGRTDSSSR